MYDDDDVATQCMMLLNNFVSSLSSKLTVQTTFGFFFKKHKH